MIPSRAFNLWALVAPPLLLPFIFFKIIIIIFINTDFLVFGGRLKVYFVVQ